MNMHFAFALFLLPNVLFALNGHMVNAVAIGVIGIFWFLAWNEHK